MSLKQIFIVRLPAPLQQQDPLKQQKLLAEIVYRWVATLCLLLSAVTTLLVLTGV